MTRDGRETEASEDADLVEALREAVVDANEALFETRRQLEHQCDVAARVHRSLLPSAVRHPRINVDVRYLPVEPVGGDYCQVRVLEPSVCYVTLCHVSGKGIAPAILATRVSSEVRHFILENMHPSEIVGALNEFICEYFHDVKMRLTFMAARIDLDLRTVTYSGAGHPGAMLLSSGEGALQRLASQNISIGVRKGILGPKDKSESAVPIAAGDRLLFFTDGITRSTGDSNRQLGQNGLAGFATRAMSEDLFGMADVILDQLARFRNGPPQDDRTLIVAEIIK